MKVILMEHLANGFSNILVIIMFLFLLIYCILEIISNIVLYFFIADEVVTAIDPQKVEILQRYGIVLSVGVC